MFGKKSTLALAAAALTAALVAAPLTAATAAITPSGSLETMWIWDGSDGAEKLIPAGQTIQWGEPVYAHPNDTDYASYTTMFTGPQEAKAVSLFLSARGKETSYADRLGKGPNGFNNPDAKTVLAPQVTLQDLGGTDMGTVKANGGDYSLGMVFTDITGVTVYAATFVHITVQPGGAWTYQPTIDVTDEPGEGDPTMTGSVDLEATTVAGQDGSLSLAVPAAAKATFSTATLVGGKSTSTATLPEVTVTDERVVSKKGWTLTQSVTDFVNGQTTIDKKNLGVTPKVNAEGTTATGVVASTAQTAGSATFPSSFAEAPAGSGVGVTKLGADLTLVAPADAPAGTYTSKMTLTLVSK